MMRYYYVNIDKIIIPNEFFLVRKGFKYLTGYQYDDRINPLCIMPPKVGRFSKSFDKNKFVFFY